MVGPRAALFDQVRDLPPERVVVGHEPLTPRYGRAQQTTGHLLKRGQRLGWRLLSGRELATAFELAMWAPSFRGRGYGYYACFRVWLGNWPRIDTSSSRRIHPLQRILETSEYPDTPSGFANALMRRLLGQTPHLFWANPLPGASRPWPSVLLLRRQ